MQLLKILIVKEREESPRIKNYNDTIKCLQQSNIADNDCLEFIKPMAEYLAKLFLNQ